MYFREPSVKHRCYPMPRKKLAPAAIATGFVTAAYLGDPIVATNNRIVSSVDFANGTLSIAAQPDCPRNLTVTLTDANSSVTAGTVTITGLSCSGETITEVCTAAQARTGFVGTRIFASVTSVVIAAAAGATAGTDVIVVGVGSVIGLPSPIVAAGAVKHVYLGGVRIASPTIATGQYNSGVNASSGTYNGSKGMIVYYAPGS